MSSKVISKPKEKLETKTKKKVTLKQLILFSLPIFILCIGMNIMYFTPHTTLSQFFDALINYDKDDLIHYVVVNVKLPRIIGAMTVGAYLAVAGAVMQGITRNYLASPDVVGVSDGANLGLSIAMALTGGMTSYANNIVFAMIGATISTLSIFYISSRIRGRESGVKLLLAGSALGMLFSGFSTSINIWSGLGQPIQVWNNSGLLGIKWLGIGILGIGLIGVIIAFLIAGRITVLGMGDETAISLGQNVKLTKTLGVISVVLISASTVCTVGNIGFVGLIIPNMVKMAVGEDFKKVIPYSAFFGSILLTFSDMVSRLINYPFETPIGTITSIIGIPIFLYLINGKRTKGAM